MGNPIYLWRKPGLENAVVDEDGEGQGHRGLHLLGQLALQGGEPRVLQHIARHLPVQLVTMCGNLRMRTLVNIIYKNKKFYL